MCYRSMILGQLFIPEQEPAGFWRETCLPFEVQGPPQVFRPRTHNAGNQKNSELFYTYPVQGLEKITNSPVLLYEDFEELLYPMYRDRKIPSYSILLYKYGEIPRACSLAPHSCPA